MLPATRIAEFALLAGALIIVPGPNVLFVISQSLRQGRAAGLAAVVGGQLGEVVQVSAVAFGIGAVVEASAAVFTIIKLAGAGYLVFLGVQAIRHRRALAEALGQPGGSRPVRRMLIDGFVVGATNPKAIVFFVAVLPQFADRATGYVPLQMLLLGGVFIGIALISDSVWALVAGTVRGWLGRSPRRLAAIGGTGGLAMIGIGASLALTGRKD
jgi:threonine/homoserine/homoserine lactone efflux protein